MPPDLSFNLPMEEALAFWRDKLKLSPGQFAQLSNEAKTRAFAISGIARGGELDTVYEALHKALKEGTTFGQFKEELAGIIERRGWTGPRAWRLDTIFRTNIQTAYNVGRYRQMQQIKDRRPYWRYSAVNDGRTRPAHRAVHGKIFPADHPFWDTWYPPNGFRCFPAGTPVLTPSGWRSIESICLHDAVIGGSGQSHLVTAIHLNSFNGDLVRLSFKGGVIASTPNHRILTMRGWVRADALQTGDVLVQTGKPTSIDTAVGQIDHPQAKSADGRMSLPVKGEAPVAFAFNRQIEGRNENIDPFGAVIGVDNMVVQHLQTSAGQVIKHNTLSVSGRGKAGGMLGGITTHYVASGLAHLTADLGTPGGCAVSELLSGTAGTGIDFLGLAKPGVPSFPVLSQGHLSHKISGFDLPGLGVDPLHADGLPALAWSHAEMLQQSHQRADIHLPSVTELPIGQQFIKVETAEDLGGGAPFDSFDTLDGFVAWARLHACLHKIEYIDTIPYSGTVFNLTVESDRSYIIPGATVHNCRCSVNSVSAHDLELEGWKVETVDPTGKLYEPTDPNTGVKLPARLLMPDEGWRFNPGKVSWGDAPAPGQYRDLPDLKTAADYGRRKLENVRSKTIPDVVAKPLPAKLPDDQYKTAFLDLYGEEAVVSDPLKEPVILSLRSFLVIKEPGSPEIWKFDKPGHGESIPLLRDMIEKPYEIWLTPQQSATGKIRLAKRYISLWKDETGRVGGLAVFEVAGGRMEGVTSFLPFKKGEVDLAYLEKQRNGILLYSQ